MEYQRLVYEKKRHPTEDIIMIDGDNNKDPNFQNENFTEDVAMHKDSNPYMICGYKNDNKDNNMDSPGGNSGNNPNGSLKQKAKEINQRVEELRDGDIES